MPAARTVVIVPWYEPDDFARLCHMRDGQYLPQEYERWLRAAIQGTQQLLATGSVAQIVTLNLDAYFSWLCRQGRPDSPQARLAYLYYLSGETGGEVEDVCWPERPLSHQTPGRQSCCNQEYAMAKQPGIEERAVAAAALAGRERGVSLGPKTQKLSEKHTSEELREMSTSEAAAEARARKRGAKSE